MKESGAVFGGEHSGHYYFRDNFFADSGMLAMLVLMQVLSEDGRPLSELRSQFEPYAQSGEINYRVEDKAAMIESIRQEVGGEADELDGLTLTFSDRWLNLRPSNTEPVLRLNVEASDADAVADLVGQVADIIFAGGGQQV
jgi:phosphomannomutase